MSAPLNDSLMTSLTRRAEKKTVFLLVQMNLVAATGRFCKCHQHRYVYCRVIKTFCNCTFCAQWFVLIAHRWLNFPMPNETLSADTSIITEICLHWLWFQATRNGRTQFIDGVMSRSQPNVLQREDGLSMYNKTISFTAVQCSEENETIFVM